MPINPGDVRATRGNRNAFITPTGERITRTQSENRFAQSLGFKNEYARKRADAAAKVLGLFGNKTYKAQLQKAKEHGTSEAHFRAAAVRVKMAPKDSRGNVIDKSPRGPIAKLQTLMGIRNTAADYSVGATPTVN